MSGKVDVTKDDIDKVLHSFIKSEHEELKTMEQEELEKFWFFRYDKSASSEWNVYQFSEMLELYKKKCRRWEEMHRGSCCVVERVRDTYLMPKIKKFIEEFKEHDHAKEING